MLHPNEVTAEDMANEIHYLAFCILQLLTAFDKTTSQVQVNYSKGIQMQLPDLFQQINKYQGINRQKLHQAFQTPFSSNVFNNPQPLEMIVTSIYVFVFGIEKKYGYSLLEDSKHLAYANSLIENNLSKLKNFLKS